MTDKCAICLESGNTINNVCSCNSSFHASCITKWVTEYNNTCPVCRGIIGNTRVETVIINLNNQINNVYDSIYFKCKLLVYFTFTILLFFYFYTRDS